MHTEALVRLTIAGLAAGALFGLTLFSLPSATYSDNSVNDGSPSTTLPQPQGEPDRQTLVDLYYDMDGQNWLLRGGWRDRERPPPNWLSNEPIGTWHGVTASGGRVTELRLTGQIGLSGDISPKFANLSNLRYLDLGIGSYHRVIRRNAGTGEIRNNELNGNIPPELSRLKDLRHLDLGGNKLTGSIPPELGDLTNLEFLDLSQTNLSGSIPPELGKLVNLTHLDLSETGLSGSIPPELGNLIGLEYLRLANPRLSGCIPHALRYVPNSDISTIALTLPFCAAPTPTPPPTPTPTPAPTNTPLPLLGMPSTVPSSSDGVPQEGLPAMTFGEPVVNFHASQTEVATGEPVVLTLSVTNSIANPEMTLQLILQLPSGLSITGEGLSESCTVQCSAIYTVPTGMNRDFLLAAVPNQAGTFDVAGRMEWYFGDNRESYSGQLTSLTLDVMQPEPTPTPAPAVVGEPTVNLHATQTEVGLGQPVILTLVADNSIAKPEMTLKFVLPLPSGWSMSGAGFTQACSGQCTATYMVPPGDQKSITLEMMPNQAGSFKADAMMEWFFGNDVSTLERKSTFLELTVVRQGFALGGQPLPAGISPRNLSPTPVITYRSSPESSNPEATYEIVGAIVTGAIVIILAVGAVVLVIFLVRRIFGGPRIPTRGGP